MGRQSLHVYTHTSSHGGRRVSARFSLSPRPCVCVSVFNHLDDLHVEFQASWPRRFHAGRSRVLFVQLHLAYPRVKKKKKKKKMVELVYGYVLFFLLLSAVCHWVFPGIPTVQWVAIERRMTNGFARRPTCNNTKGGRARFLWYFIFSPFKNVTHHLFLFSSSCGPRPSQERSQLESFRLIAVYLDPRKAWRENPLNKWRLSFDLSHLVHREFLTFFFFLPVAIKWMLLLLPP